MKKGVRTGSTSAQLVMWKYVVQAQIVPSLRDTVVVARESSPFVEKGPSGIGSKDEKSETIDNSVVPFLRKTTKD